MTQVIRERIVIINNQYLQFVRLILLNLHKVNQRALSMKQVIQIPGAPAPIGPYSQAILKNDTLYISGQIPLNPKSGELVVANIEDATKQVLENIGELLLAAGMSIENVVKCSIFLKDMNDFAAMNVIYGQFFRSEAPARETVQVSKLPMDVPIEISCIAIK